MIIICVVLLMGVESVGRRGVLSLDVSTTINRLWKINIFVWNNELLMGRKKSILLHIRK